MKYRILSTYAFICTILFSVTSCVKDDVKGLTSEGHTFIKLFESPENKIFFEPFSDIKPVALFSLRKDAATSVALNTPAAITLKSNPALISKYNADKGTDFEILPDSLYTLGLGNPLTAGVYQMSLGAGEFARDFEINLNGAKWNLAHKYAMAFTIADSAGLTINDGKREVLVLISIKNKWDGVYAISGTFSDATNPAFTGAYPLEWELQTTGPNQCLVVDQIELGFAGFLFSTAPGTFSYYGNFGLLVNFDPVTDKITSVINSYGQPASNTRSAELDPSGANKYDVTTKTISIKYFMKQPSVVTAPPHIRSYFNEQWKFIKPRG